MLKSSSHDKSKANDNIDGVHAMDEIDAELKVVETKSPIVTVANTNDMDVASESGLIVATKDHDHSFIPKEKISTAPHAFIFDQV